MKTHTTASRAERDSPGRFLPLVQGATLIEWTGTGLFLAVSTIYFVKVAHLSTSTVGTGLTIGGAIAVIAAVPVARLTARFGPRIALIGVMLLRAAATLGYLWVDGWWSFLVVVTLIAVTEQSSPPMVQSYVGARAPERLRAKVMAVQRTVINLGISLGGLIAGVALGSGTEAAFRPLLIGGAAAYVVTAVVYATARDETTVAAPDGAGVARLLADRALLGFTAYNALVSLWMPVLNVAFPLWLVTATEVPERYVGILYAVNTVLCILLQYPLNRCYSTARRSWLSYATAAVLLGGGALAFAAAPRFGTTGALFVLGGAITLLTFAELLQVGASWTLSFDLAPEGHRSAYLVLFNTSRTVANRVVGPVLMTGVVLALGTTGWIVLGCVMLLAALVPLAVLHARPGRPEPDTELRHMPHPGTDPRSGQHDLRHPPTR
ncbi:MFS transporter [Streptomyces minutiscleroticus]|uniref:MFS transporter n=1 Tax=Streptomyces minutiscleroticus TaxID=68238 RepID=A0A918P0F9_9ACTN|nr:MFS transporter [Streptomyces minutiscleroticus]GGY10356.1 MFS transporter [Streptomyces minutiscleroticus]